MENSYGIGVTNRYALFLDDESDPLETLKLKEQEKELKKKNKVAEKENKGKSETPSKGKPVTNQKKVIKDAAVQKVQENKREDAKPTTNPRFNFENKSERNSNKFTNENREERNNRRNREDKPYNGPTENNRDREERPRREHIGDNFENRNRSGRPLNNKIGGPRGARGSRSFEDRRGKREFDRQSGSDKTHGYRGVKPVDKREGGGAHNWGSHKDVIEEADKTNELDQSWGENEKTEVAVTANTETKENEAETEVQPVEEEPKELTLDEWKAQKASRLKPQYNIRKAGEGEDPSQWKKMYELNKKKDGDGEEQEEEEYDASDYPQRAGRQKHIEIDILFNDARRGGPGRGRGPRSGPKGNRSNRDQRGGGGVGADKQGSRFRANDEQVDERTDNRSAPKVDDERDFPSLG